MIAKIEILSKQFHVPMNSDRSTKKFYLWGCQNHCLYRDSTADSLLPCEEVSPQCCSCHHCSKTADCFALLPGTRRHLFKCFQYFGMYQYLLLFLHTSNTEGCIFIKNFSKPTTNISFGHLSRVLFNSQRCTSPTYNFMLKTKLVEKVFLL